jgi:hypothetical protein
MSVVTKEEWMEWRRNPVTKAFYEAILERIEEAKDILSSSAGVDPVTDNFYRGFINAYRETLNFRIEDMDEN